MTDSLLSRLQALTEPSRKIDAEIALANGWINAPLCEDSIYQWRKPKGGWFVDVPHYTGSLDATLTLWDGCVWSVSRFSDAYQATVSVHSAHGPTPAIALLIAIRMAQEESKP